MRLSHPEWQDKAIENQLTRFGMYYPQTKQYKDYCIEYAPYIHTMTWKISMDILNKFFVEDLDVWRTENPRNEIFDWTKVSVDPKALEKTKWCDLSISLYQLCKY